MKKDLDLFDLYKEDLLNYELISEDDLLKHFKIYKQLENLNIITNNKLDIDKLLENINTTIELNQMEKYIIENYINKYPLTILDKQLINKFYYYKNNFIETKVSNIDSLNELIKYNEIMNSKEIIINSNLRLVICIAKKYYTKEHILDLISAGNEGLIRSIDTFDPKKTKFSTYASYWINAYIIRYIRNNKLIHIPLYVQDEISKIKENVEKSNKNYTEEELKLYEEYKKLTTIHSINKLIDDEGNEAAHYIKGDDDLIIGLIQAEEHEYLMSLLNNLSTRERDIITYKYGLEREIKKLKDIAKLYNTTSSSISVTEKRAYKKLQKIIEKEKKLYK